MTNEIKLKKRLIFTITSGRSGTKYLSRLCGIIPETTVLHEPEPSFQKYLSYAKSNDWGELKKYWTEKKIPFIKNQFGNNYIETNHVFAKGFIEPLLELKIIPDIILLKRNASEIARSIYRLNTIPEITKKGKMYLISPKNPNFLPLNDYDINRFHPYQLCYWYALETHFRQTYYMNYISSLGGKCITINFEELKSPFLIFKICKQLNLPIPNLFLVIRRWYQSQGFKNDKLFIESEYDQNIDYKKLEKEILELLNPYLSILVKTFQ